MSDAMQARDGFEMTLDEFFSSEYFLGEGKYEFAAGEIITMMSPAGTDHEDVSAVLIGLFVHFLRGKTCRVYGSNAGLFLWDNEFRIPDMFVVCDPGKISDNKCVGSPDLVVEIITKWSKNEDIIRKRESYRRAGINEFWIVDLVSKSVVVENFHLGVVKRFDLGERVRSWKFESLDFDLYEIFEGIM
ncbi:MAG: Uma2 family endonuclease [Peptococcaceae bacterium]|jgi:Uma2 family endonuclease|nr:Uma2 family endonuclease [Peptococcaceae bacterium]